MKKNKRQPYKPSGWQLDPEVLSTPCGTVQYWVDLTMVTAMMPITEAKELVRGGFAFVTTSQSISKMENGFAVER